MSNIAIIPARGGSKRIPKKNIKAFCGKPIIAYSIEAALKSRLFDEVMVSTDDESIAVIALQYGATVPFMRTEKNADDYATTFDVLNEVLQRYKTLNRIFEYGCCIYPTAPLVTGTFLHTAFNTIKEQDFDSVFPVVKYSYPIWRSLKIENKRALMQWPENIHKRSQDMSSSYHDAGQFYWFNTERISKSASLFTANSGVIILDELQVQDIDSEQDWQLAEMKYRLLYTNYNV